MATAISRTATAAEIAEHLKAIGQAIITDAEKLKIETDNLLSIHIDAEINPWEAETSISYQISRSADPRAE